MSTLLLQTQATPLPPMTTPFGCQDFEKGKGKFAVLLDLPKDDDSVLNKIREFRGVLPLHPTA